MCTVNENILNSDNCDEAVRLGRYRYVSPAYLWMNFPSGPCRWRMSNFESWLPVYFRVQNGVLRWRKMSNIVAKYTILLHMNNCYSKYVNYEPLVGLRSVVFTLHNELVVHLISSVMTKFKLTYHLWPSYKWTVMTIVSGSQIKKKVGKQMQLNIKKSSYHNHNYDCILSILYLYFIGYGGDCKTRSALTVGTTVHALRSLKIRTTRKKFGQPKKKPRLSEGQVEKIP